MVNYKNGMGTTKWKEEEWEQYSEDKFLCF